MDDTEKRLQSVLEAVETIAKQLKANPADVNGVKRAADDLLAVCRYRSNVLGNRGKLD